MSSQEEVLEIMEKKMFQVPVTDINNHLLGVIRNDALIDATKRK